MTRDVKSRSQRRMEKKQALLLLVLMLAVSLVSFSLGVMIGKSGSSTPAIPAAKAEPERIQVVKQDPPPAAPAPAAREEVLPPVAAEPEPLTFFDTLPRGQEAPLGSGINRPRTPAAEAPRTVPDAPRTPASERPETRATTPPAPAPSPAARVSPAPDTQGRFVVQVGSFRAADDADALSKRLRAKEFPAFVQQADLGERGTWYRVRLGPYAQSAEAQAMVARLKTEERIDAFVANR